MDKSLLYLSLTNLAPFIDRSDRRHILRLRNRLIAHRGVHREMNSTFNYFIVFNDKLPHIPDLHQARMRALEAVLEEAKKESWMYKPLDF